MVLTVGQDRFAQLYVASGDPLAAAEQIYNNRGYASALMASPHVQQAIVEHRFGVRSRAEAIGITRDRVLVELAAIAFANVADYLNYTEDSVTIKPLIDLTLAQASAIKSVEMGRDARTSITFHGKMDALKTLANILGMTGQDINVVQQSFVIQAPMTIESSAEFERVAQSFLELEAKTVEPATLESA